MPRSIRIPSSSVADLRPKNPRAGAPGRKPPLCRLECEHALHGVVCNITGLRIMPNSQMCEYGLRERKSRKQKGEP